MNGEMKMYTLYYSCRNGALFNMMNFFKENEIEYASKQTTQVELTKSEFMHMLHLTENGLDDIFSTRSNAYKQFVKGRIDVESLSINEVFELIVEYPTLLRSPIAVGEEKMSVGYNEEDIGRLIPRAIRKAKREELMATSKVEDIRYYVLDDIEEAL